MGTNDHDAKKEEGPAKLVQVSPFFIDETEISNDQFSEFVRETGYRTDSEKFGWSFAFHLWIPHKVLIDVSRSVKGSEWWVHVNKAFWREPAGPGTSIAKRGDHPVVHVSWNDARAFCRWAGKRLPTEKEWEFAARGGLEEAKYPWGKELDVKKMNTWQGAFPMKNSKEDGFDNTAPVKSFSPNSYGLYNVLGNVWEWVEDEFAPGKRAQRGGSYMDSNDGRFNHRVTVTARTGNTPESAADNTGFRCAADSEHGQLPIFNDKKTRSEL